MMGPNTMAIDSTVVAKSGMFVKVKEREGTEKRKKSLSSWYFINPDRGTILPSDFTLRF
jgi:hypothetical protein